MSHNRYIRVRGRVFLVRGRRKLGPHEYLILKTLGHGGRQRYLAFDPSAGPGGDLRQIIVLNRRETLSQRIAILQRLSQGNPNLPTILVYDPGRSETSIVTTWVWGEDLDKYLKAARKGCVSLPSPTETCKLLRGLAHGLYHLYKGHGIIHGDIKPANLILAPDPNRLVMVDFGSAWTVEKTVRRLEGDGVSEAYAAPEQLMHRPAVDFRSDQFSASVVAYQLLTDEIPYAKMGGRAGLPENRPIFESRYEPPSRLCLNRGYLPDRIWKQIDAVVATGLALDPARRFQSNKDWLDALEELHGEIRARTRVKFRLWDKVAFRLFGLVSKRHSPLAPRKDPLPQGR